MAKWLMFDAAFSDIGGLPSANFFRFQHLKGKFTILQNFMVCRVRGAESNSEGPRFV